MKFVVDRATWRAGGGGKHKSGRGSTQLLNKSGCRCCLGFVAAQCGVPDEQLRSAGEPSCLDPDFAKPIDGILVRLENDHGWDVYNNALSWDAMDINDNCRITRDEREEKLAALFAKHGHELEFTGEYAERGREQEEART